MNIPVTAFRFQFYHKLQKSTIRTKSYVATSKRRKKTQLTTYRFITLLCSATITIIFNENNSLFVKIHHQMEYNELTIARLIVIML